MQRHYRAAMLFALGLAVSLSLVGSAFTIDEVLDNGTASDPSDDLEDAARWTNTSGSFVVDGIRGLGGGLEYALAQDFFDRMLPAFVDQVKPTRAQLLEAIRRAFDRWADGSPLRFVDVSDQVFALPDLGFPGSGAEIDLIAVPGGDRAFRNTTLAGNTFVTFGMERPMGTNGREMSGRTISSADILFNMNASYYLNPNDPEVQRLQQTGTALTHFESLLVHEISHAIGLDHPDEFPWRNFDTDADPQTPMVLDCQDPLQGLKLSPNIDWNAVATSRGSGSLRLELTPDDLGGREFLYPSCGQIPRPRPSPGPPPPMPGGGSSLKSYDANNNNLLDDTEFFAIIDAWIAGQLENDSFFKAVDLWVSQSPIGTARVDQKPLMLDSLSVRPTRGAITFIAQGRGITSTAVQIFDLRGRLIFDQETSGTRLTWNLSAADGQVMANGVYLYLVQAKGYDGKVLRTEVRKLVVQR